jgi:hypothetical protein
MLEYGKGAYQRTRGNLPEFETVNMYYEQGGIMQSRLPLKAVVEVGTGPIQATAQKNGVFNGDRFTISGGKAYRNTTQLGNVVGTGPASIAMRNGEVLFNAGGAIYSYNGTDFVTVSFPGNATQVFHTNGYFIALKADTGFWFFSAKFNGRSWDLLDYAEIESSPDNVSWAVVLDGLIVFAGPESIEFWSPTGNPDLPYTPIQNRIFEQGIIAPGCMVQDDNSFFWIGNDRIFYRNGEVPQAIGGDFLTERIEASSSWRLYLLKDERHKFVCIRLDTETWVYDLTTGEVCEFRSYQKTNFRCGPDFGDDSTGTIWAWGEYGNSDEPVVERILTAGERLVAPKIYDNVTLECEVGTTPYLTGNYVDPSFEYRFSDDGANLWTAWETETLGEQGDYRKVVEFRALGMYNMPGFMMQVRMTNPVPFRVSSIYENVNAKGRA